MPLKTGKYNIFNRQYATLAVLPDSKLKTELVSENPARAKSGEVWFVDHFRDNKYSITNKDCQRLAGCDIPPKENDPVYGSNVNQLWTINETRERDQYTISAAAIDYPNLFWGLANDEEGYPVTLSSSSDVPENKWLIFPAHY